jgi:hypothetical protein
MATPTRNSSQQHHTWIVTFCEGWTCPWASANGWDGALSLGFRLHVLMDRARKTEWRYRRRGYRQQHNERNSRWDRPYCPSGRLRRSIFSSGVEGMGIERDTQVEKNEFRDGRVFVFAYRGSSPGTRVWHCCFYGHGARECACACEQNECSKRVLSSGGGMLGGGAAVSKSTKLGVGGEKAHDGEGGRSSPRGTATRM